MEIFGGFMVMMSIIGLFLAVIWLIMPFVVFAIKGRQDRSMELLETIEQRLAIIDQKLTRLQSVPASQAPNDDQPTTDRNMQPPAVPEA